MRVSKRLRIEIGGLLLLAALLSGCDDQDNSPAAAAASTASIESSNCTSAAKAGVDVTSPRKMNCVPAPSISGVPPQTILAGSAFSFRPTVTRVVDAPLVFSIQNKPAWASFDATTGALVGTPVAADVGSYEAIRIAVTDGINRATLTAFSITVTQTASGTVTLSWVPPVINTDGTPMTNLAGYRIYYGTSSTALTQTITVDSAGVTDYVIENLTPGTWYFAIAAYNSSGVDSPLTPIVPVNI